MPGFSGRVGEVYNVLKDYAATLVFFSVVIAAIRRAAFKPARYAVPAEYGKDHTTEAVFILGLIATLMVADGLFEASQAAAQLHLGRPVEFLAVLSLPWIFKNALISLSLPTLQNLRFGSYLVHDIT